MKEKISIIIPTYNREKYIKKAVESCLNQTYSNIEIIVVDDKSTDNTESVLKSIKDERLKYIKLDKNRGACYARNVGIKKATGKYIAFNDSDDVFRKDKLEKQLNNLKSEKADLDFCRLVEHSGDKLYEFPLKKQENNLTKRSVLEELCYGNVISTQTILAKSSIFKDILFDESLPRLQDYDLVLRIASKYKISHTKEILVDMYKQKNSISFSYDKLEKACIIMLKKDYDIDDDNLYNLQKTLLYLGSKRETDRLHNEFNDERKRRDKEVNKQKKDYLKLENLYNSIINSRRWKLINKIIPNKKRMK